MMLSIEVLVEDPVERKSKFGMIDSIVPCKSGLLGKIAGTNYNVYRPWNSEKWLTNVTSSTRFTLETEGMTVQEMYARKGS